MEKKANHIFDLFIAITIGFALTGIMFIIGAMAGGAVMHYAQN